MAAPNQNASEILEALAARLQSAFPPQGSPPRVNGDANGYGALRVEVEAINTRLNDYRQGTETRISELSSKIDGFGRSLADFVQAQGKSGGDNFFKLAGLVAGIVTIALTIGGAFGSLAKSNLDTNIAFTNEKVVTGDRNITGQMDRLVSVVDRLSEVTMPRPEVDAKINQGVAERQDLRNIKADKSSLAEMDRRLSDHFDGVSKDIARLQHESDDIREKQVSRAELEQHWKEAQDRLNINADRILSLQKELSGGSVSDRLKTLQDQLDTLRQKFIVVPQAH